MLLNKFALLSFFKINEPFRLVPIFLIAFLLKLPAFIHPVQYTETTHWFVIGEAIQSGMLYVDIWDSIAPFSAILYQVIVGLFGRSILALYLIGTLLTFFQAAIFNNMLMRAKVFENTTYVPALIYVLFTSAHPAFFTLSPTLMGLTLVLLGLGNLLRHVEFRAKKDIQIIMIGLYFGMASLFYFPFIVFLIIAVILLLVFTNTLGRRYFLLIYGGVFPLITAFFYYWIKSDQPGYFINNFVLLYNFSSNDTNLGWFFGLYSLTVPALFMLLGLLSFGKQRRLTNYQTRIVQLFLLFGGMLLGMLMLETPITYYSLVVYIPIFVFFTVHFTTLFKRALYANLLSLLLVGGVFLSLWANTFNWGELIRKENTYKTEKYIPIVRDKSVMVLGDGRGLYKEAKLAGPFYSWKLSEDFFNNLDYYDNLIFLQNQLEDSKPDVILDLNGIWPTIEKRLPQVAKNYFEAQPNVWKRKN